MEPAESRYLRVGRSTSPIVLLVVLFGIYITGGCEKNGQDSTNENASATASPSGQSADADHGRTELPDWLQHVIQGAKDAKAKIQDEITGLDSKIAEATKDPDIYFRRGELRFRLRQYVGFQQSLKLDDKALSDFDMANKLAGPHGHIEALVAAARVHLGRYEFAAGEDYVGRAKALDSDNVGVRCELAVLDGLRTGDWDRPIKTLRSLSDQSENKNYLAVWSSLGFACYQAHRYADAERAYRKRLELQPDLRYLPTLGMIYAELGEPELGQKLMTIAVDANPGDVYAGINLAARLNAMFDPEKSREAIRVLSAVLDLAPTIPAGWNNLGIAQDIVGNHSEAIAAYQKAVFLHPGFADAYYNMGIAYDEWGLYGKATEAYKKALQYEPDSAKILYNLGLTNAHAQQLPEAEKIFLRMTEMTPQDQRVWNTLGWILFNQGKYEEARPKFERALTIDAKGMGPASGLGAVKLKAGDVAGATECFQRLVAAHPDDPAAAGGVAEALLRGADSTTALQVANALIQGVPDSAVPLIVHANIQLRDNRTDRAIADCARAIQMNERMINAYTIRGIAYLLDRNYSAALEDFKKVLVLKPDHSYAAMWSWSAWMALGDTEAAKRGLAVAAKKVGHDSWQGNLIRALQGELSPDDLLQLAQNDERRCEAYYYIGERMFADGNTDKAISSFKKCLETNVVYFFEPVLARRHLDAH